MKTEATLEQIHQLFEMALWETDNRERQEKFYAVIKHLGKWEEFRAYRKQRTAALWDQLAETHGQDFVDELDRMIEDVLNEHYVVVP